MNNIFSSPNTYKVLIFCYMASFYLSENGVWLTDYIDVKYIIGELN
ncbi:hypothetical protein [Clostridium cavendishii]|nr:hypothetical protein [Clostridium cavendishii]